MEDGVVAVFLLHQRSDDRLYVVFNFITYSNIHKCKPQRHKHILCIERSIITAKSVNWLCCDKSLLYMLFFTHHSGSIENQIIVLCTVVTTQ